VARTYPFSAGTLAIEGGVPFGVAAAASVTFTTAAPRNKNRHMCWYGTSGAGKGYSLRVLLSRERFANGLRVYGIDQDEQQEYAGRFCDYLGGSRVPIRTVADAQRFAELWAETPHVEVGIAIPIGCTVPLAIAAAVLVGAGVLLGQRFQPAAADHVVVRVIDDGAAGGPQVLSTQVVPLR
jgi:hypothetical protein